MPNKIITDIFTSFQSYLISEQDIRDVSTPIIIQKRLFIIKKFQEIRNIIKDIESNAREIATVLQIIHRDSSSEDGM